jgi:hypothetical protein
MSTVEGAQPKTFRPLAAGQSKIEVKAAWEVPVDVTAHAATPHMHLLGRDMLMFVKFPDRTVPCRT